MEQNHSAWIEKNFPEDIGDGFEQHRTGNLETRPGQDLYESNAER